jgi:hypothetical protein
VNTQQFDVVKVWANWDSEKRQTVETFDNRPDAERCAQLLNDMREWPWHAYRVERQYSR